MSLRTQRRLSLRQTLTLYPLPLRKGEATQLAPHPDVSDLQERSSKDPESS